MNKEIMDAITVEYLDFKMINTKKSKAEILEALSFKYNVRIDALMAILQD